MSSGGVASAPESAEATAAVIAESRPTGPWERGGEKQEGGGGGGVDRRKGGEGGSATSDTGCWASPRDGDAAGWQPGPLMAGTAVHNEPPGHPGW